MTSVDNSTPDYSDDLQDFTPKQIAQEIFSKQPAQACTNNMLIDQDLADPIYIFEILLTILVEGLEIFTKNVFPGGLKEADLSNFSTENITQMNPWFHSLGFYIKVESELLEDLPEVEGDSLSSYDSEESENSEDVVISDHYCRVILNRDSYKGLFMINNTTDAPYHFLLNGVALDDNMNKQNLQDLQAAFEANGTMYKISFDFYIPMDRPTQIV